MTKWFVLAYVIISVLLFDPKMFSGGDNAVYIILAESLATGHGYRDLHIVGAPPHKTYPPGMALILAPFIAIFGRNLILLKCMIMLFGVGGLLIFEKLARLFLPPPFGSLATWAYLLTPSVIIYGHYTLSEIPYLFFSLAAIWFCLKGEKND